MKTTVIYLESHWISNAISVHHLYFYLSCYFRCSSEVFWDLPLHRVNCRHYSLLLANVLLCCPMSCPFPLPIAIAGEIDFGFRSRYYLPIYKSLSCGLAGCWLCPGFPHLWLWRWFSWFPMAFLRHHYRCYVYDHSCVLVLALVQVEIEIEAQAWFGSILWGNSCNLWPEIKKAISKGRLLQSNYI